MKPSVGIFWRVDGILVSQGSTLDEAEPYGDCLTHATGHYECWERWQKLGSQGLRKEGYPLIIASSEYDDWPRGRIVYETLGGRFVLYADRRLQKPAIIQDLVRLFGLERYSVSVQSDAHYRS